MPRRVTALAAALSALVLLAGGCSGDSSDTASEKAIEKAAKEQGQDVNVDVDGDKIKVESSDGTIVAGGGELPDGYPADQVPVIDGEILVGIAVKGEGYQVTVSPDLSPQAAMKQAISLLESAGVTEQEGGGFLGPQSALLEGNGYSVLLSASDAAGQTTVAYIVGNQ